MDALTLHESAVRHNVAWIQPEIAFFGCMKTLKCEAFQYGPALMTQGRCLPHILYR